MDGVDVKRADSDSGSSSDEVSNDLDNTVSSNKNTTLTIRQQLGKQLSNITDLINDNLIVVRYATFSTVLLLGAYGIANNPLFYRHKSVIDIPISAFTKRKCLHGRIVGIVERSSGRSSRSASSSSSSNGVASLLSSSLQRNTVSSNSRESNNASDLDSQQHPIVLLFRHSSPMERLLSKSSSMEKMLKFTGQSTTGLLYTSANPHRNLLPIELAGVVSPPFTSPPSILSTSLTGSSSSSNTFTLIDELIQQKTKVSIQLLAQRVAAVSNQYDKKENGDRYMNEDRIQNTVICHLNYKQPKQYFWQTSNAGLEMVQRGEAWSCGVVVPLSNIEDKGSENKPKANESTTINYHPTVKQLHDDTKYVSQLEEAEYTAWQSERGMWSSKHIREIRKEYIEYEEEEKKKWSVLSLLKRGFDFVRRR